MIRRVNEICNRYAAQGYTLTLRQLYYQLVASDVIPNRVEEYNKLGDVVNNGRLAGMIDWNHLEDRTRNLQRLAHWDDPASIISASAAQFRYDRWANQPVRPEVWIEKEALAGVFERICNELRVPFFSCRGYTSQSEAWRAGQRMIRYLEEGKQPVILHFGDHDPSGIDMTRDVRDRLSLFAGEEVRLERLALNMDQIDQYGPPPNPAKVTDSRFVSYQQVYGDESWELDALDPATLSGLVRSAIEGLRDETAWAQAIDDEQAARQALTEVSRNWDAVRAFALREDRRALGSPLAIEGEDEEER